MALPFNSEIDRHRKNLNWLRALLWLVLLVQAIAAMWIAKPWLTADSDVYLQLSAGLNEFVFGRITTSGFQPDALRPPGYPIILNLLVERLGLQIAAVVVLQLGLYLLSVRLLEQYMRRHNLPSIPFLVLAVIYPFGAIYSAYVMSEAWAALGLTVVAILMMRRETSAMALFIAGGIAGLAALVRSDMLLLPVFLGAITLWRGRRSPGRAVGQAAIPTVAASLILAPYALWNLTHFGRASPTPIAAAVGNSLYLATWQRNLPREDLDATYEGDATERVKSSGLADEIRRLNLSFGAPAQIAPFNPAGYPTQAMQIRSGEVFRAAALKRIQDDPEAYAGHIAANSWDLWNTSAYPPGVPWFAKSFLVLTSALVWAAGLLGAGLAFGRARGWPIGAAGAVILLYPMLVHLPLHTEARYTAAARPLLLLYASLAVVWIWQSLRREGDRQEVPG